MPNIEVEFNEFDVQKDGEANEKGRVYWCLKADGVIVNERSSSNPLRVTSGDHVDLTSSKTVQLAANESLTVSGYLGEKDHLLSGKDENAPFVRSYAPSQNWGAGEHRVTLEDRALRAILTFNIRVH